MSVTNQRHPPGDPPDNPLKTPTPVPTPPPPMAPALMFDPYRRALIHYHDDTNHRTKPMNDPDLNSFLHAVRTAILFYAHASSLAEQCETHTLIPNKQARLLDLAMRQLKDAEEQYE